MSATGGVSWCLKQVLSSQIVHINLSLAHPSDGLGLKHEDTYYPIVILCRVIRIVLVVKNYLSTGDDNRYGYSLARQLLLM